MNHRGPVPSILVTAVVCFLFAGNAAAVSRCERRAGERLTVLLVCDPTENFLVFLNHKGTYAFARELEETDAAGQRSLVCEYAPLDWVSTYVLGKDVRSARSLDDLTGLLDEADLSEPETAYVREGLGDPLLRVEYVPGQETNTIFGIGMETLREGSTEVIVDWDNYMAGVGGTYRTGENCEFRVDRLRARR